MDVSGNPRKHEPHGCHHDHAAILDGGAALDCIGEVAAARAAQAITASGGRRRPAVVNKIQRFKFGGDGDPVEASFAVTLPVQMGDTKRPGSKRLWFLAALLI